MDKNIDKLDNKSFKPKKEVKKKISDLDIVNYCVKHGVSFDTAKNILKAGNKL